MIDNELQVRLLHAAKDRTGWKQASSRPKLGEVCLESSEDPDNNLGLVFKIKIGDNHRKFCRYTGSSEVIPPPLTPEDDWDFTSSEVLPYFGTVVTASGTPQVFSLYKYPNDYSTVGLRGKTVARIYQLTLSATESAGETSIALGINQNSYKEIRPGNNITFTGNETTVPSSTILEISASMDFNSLDVGDIALAEIHKADPEDTSDADAIRVYKINEVNGKIYKSSNFVDIKVSSPLTLSTTAGIGIQDGTTSQKGAVQLLDTYTTGTSGNSENNTKATTNKAITAAINGLDGKTTTLDNTTNSLDIINTVTETNGIVSSTKKTLLAGNKINLVVPTNEETNAGKIIINHDTVTAPSTTQGTQNIPSGYTEGEKETLVITDVTTDGYGHITSYKSEASTNLVAADIKAPVTKTDNTTWNYRETGGDITIGEDTAKIPSLKGNTMVWNQASKAFASGDWTLSTGFSIQDGILSISGSSVFYGRAYVTSGTTLVPGHKYYIAFDVMGTQSDFINIGIGSMDSGTSSEYLQYITKTQSSWTRISGISAGSTTNTGIIDTVGIMNRGASANIDLQFKNLIVIDLTKMFGSGNEPDIDTFEKLFPNSYYPYCEGRLVNLGGYGVKWNQLYDTTVPTAVTDHKYYLSEVVSSTKTSSISTTISYTSGSTNRMCIDLTMMFGSGSEPTLEEFEAMFPEDYYEYDAGTEMNIFDVAAGENKLGLISTGNIPDESEPHAVDMGLPSGLLWADSNIDVTQEDGFAASPYQYGCTMFSWGNVDGHNTPATGTTFDYNWGGVNAQEPWYDGQVYGSTSGNSLTADIVTHNASQDAAYRNVGAPWHMPSSTEFQELVDNCDYIDASGNIITDTNKLTTVSGAVGIYLRSKINGNRLFFACSGYGSGSSWGGSGSAGYYWVVSFISARYTHVVSFNNEVVNLQNYSTRFNGLAVRPVRYKKQTLDLDWIREIEYTPEGSSTPEKLFPYGLLSAGSVHDEVTETKAIKRVGIVDLGKCTWSHTTSNNREIFLSNDIVNSVKKPGSVAVVTLLINAYGYNSVSQDVTWVNMDASILAGQSGVGGQAGSLICINNLYSTESSFKTAMSGVLLYYELATPVEIPLAETHRMSYLVDDHGTEQQKPVNVSSVINAPFVGTFEYYSNFKDAIRDAIRDLLDKVNNQKNPVKGIDDTPQTNGKLAVYDSDHTVESSNYSVLPSGNPFEGSTTNILLPTAEQIITYVNNVVASTLTYKGTVSTWEGLPTSGQSNGDLWIASAVITHDGNTYYPGTFFIWNSGDPTAGTAVAAHWDIVASNTTVSDKNPYLWIEDPEDPTSIISGGTKYKVGTINGTSIHVRVPELPDIAGKQTSGNVLVGNGTGTSDTKASWRGLKLDETVNNNNTSIGDLTTGLLERYDNGTLDTHSYQWRLADTSAITLINPTNSSATAGKVLVGNYNARSETHTTPPSWRNLKLDELSYDGTNLIPNLGTGLLKRTGNNSWVLTEESLVWKTTSGTTNFNAVSSDGTSLTNKIHNYTDVTTIELGSHTESSNNIVDGFRINVPLITSNSALSGLVLQGNKVDSGGTVSGSLPSWGRLKVDDLDDIYNILHPASTPTPATTGYLKRVDNGDSADPRYTWEFDPYGGSGVMPYKSNSAGTGDVATSSKTTAEINLLPTAGEKVLARTALREQVGTNNYVYHKISVGALENDSNIVLVLNGNFS